MGFRLPAPRTRHFVIGLLVLGSTVEGLRAQQSAVPADMQAAILTRMLNYDRALKSRAGDTVVIAVIAKPQDRTSAQTQAEMIKAISALLSDKVQGLPLAVVSGDYKDPADLAAWLTQKKVQVLYVAPGLAKELDGIRGVCAEMKIVSVSAVRDFVERGLVAGIVLKENRPRILVNLPAATAAGLDLDPKLLALSEVIR
jgi:hypothetical protein